MLKLLINRQKKYKIRQTNAIIKNKLLYNLKRRKQSMKKLLFGAYSLDLGGIEKALVILVNKLQLYQVLVKIEIM